MKRGETSLHFFLNAWALVIRHSFQPRLLTLSTGAYASLIFVSFCASQIAMFWETKFLQHHVECFIRVFVSLVLPSIFVFPSLYLLAVVSVVSLFSLFIIFLLRVNVTLFHTNIGKCDLLVDCTRGWLLIGATKWNVATVHSTPLGRVYGPELRPPMLFGESMGWRGNRGWLLH